VKKRLLICLLAGQALVAHAEERDADSPQFLTNARGVVLKPSNDVLSLPLINNSSAPRLHSTIALIYDQQTQRPLYTKNPDALAPIASITKLMTAMVVLDAQLPLDEKIIIDAGDVDRLKGTRSRLRVGMAFTRGELLKLALMASENRAATALARTYPGGMEAALAAMNAKARALGMRNTRFLDPSGLNSDNVSTARDLVRMVAAAREYDAICEYTTAASHSVDGRRGRALRFVNTNPLVRNASWDIGVSKTGYINEAGRCLVMEANINQRPVIIVLLDSWGKLTRVGDANRIKKWMESGKRVRSRDAQLM
jgi:D-alanyl-D-alanine endopeptidase (penicillin-binding protein 7)